MPVSTRLLVRAKEWEAGNNDASLLLQGDDLRKAETWLAQAVAKKPAPTPLHAQYISASRQTATNCQRRLLAGVSVALVVSIALAILSLFLFSEANINGASRIAKPSPPLSRRVRPSSKPSSPLITPLPLPSHRVKPNNRPQPPHKSATPHKVLLWLDSHRLNSSASALNAPSFSP